MTDKKTYTKEEISKILNKASEIQTQKDLYGDQQGLNEEELAQLAEELGIDADSLQEAILNYDNPKWDISYNWRKGTSRIQDISVLQGEVSDETWEDIVLEIRRVTGGIGKTMHQGNTYEWEQRKNDIGYKHFSLTSQDGKTKLQMVDSWSALKLLASMMGVFAGSLLFLIIFKEIDTKTTGLLLAPVGGLLGFGFSRVYMKYYYEKQKNRFGEIKQSIIKMLGKSGSGAITIEEKEAYTDTNSDQTSSSSSRVNS